jgi:hypothetical protein
LLSLFLLSGMSGNAWGQQLDNWLDSPPEHRFEISLDLVRASLDTVLRVDSIEGEPGTPIDAEQNLGMDHLLTIPEINFRWRFAKNHRVALGHYSVDRSGSAVTGFDVKINGQVFSPTLPVSSSLDIDLLHAYYGYSLINNPKAELAISGGLSKVDIDFALAGHARLGGPINYQSQLSVPLPIIGLTGGYAFSERWSLRGSVGYLPFSLALDDETNLRGDVAMAKLGVHYQTFENLRIGLLYDYFRVDVDWGNAGGFNSVQYQSNGPAISLTASF